MLRLLKESDIPHILKEIEDFFSVAKNYQDITFSPEKTKLTLLRCLKQKECICWVYEKDGVPVASMAAEIGNFDFSAHRFAIDKWTYIKPEFRGTRTGYRFLCEVIPAYIKWATSFEKVVKVFIGSSSGTDSKKIVKTFKSLGAKEYATLLSF